MQTTGTVKVGAAFLTGVMLALGGAFVYVRATEPHAIPATASVSLDESPATAPDLSVPEQKPVEPAPAEKTNTPATAETKSSDTKSAKPHPKPRLIAAAHPHVTSRPLSLAVPREEQSVPPATQPIAADVAVNPPMAVPDSQPAPTPTPVPPQPHTVTIPAGTSLAIRLGEKLSTDRNFTGDTFRASLETPIIMDGFIIADRGAKVLGRIVKAQKPGKLDGMAELSLVLTEVSTTDGQRVAIETNQSLRKGPSNTNEEVIKMAGGAALGAIIGAIAGGGKGAAIGAGAGGMAGTGAVLLGKGKPAVIDNETRLTFQLASPTTITEKLN